MVSDFSDYMTGEVVTLDGGEWIYNAGEFSLVRQNSKNIMECNSEIYQEKNKYLLFK